MHAHFKKHKVTTAFIAVMFSSHSMATGNLERRMVIEVEPTAVHFAIADVNADTDRIYRHLDNGSEKLSFASALSSTGDAALKIQAISELKQVFQKFRRRKDHFRVKKVRAVAPDTLASAAYTKLLKKEVISKSNINIKILNEDERDYIDFFSLISLAKDQQNFSGIVIGNNCIGIIATDQNAHLSTYRIQTGTKGFITYLKEVAQKKSPQDNTAITPISTSEINLGISFSRFLLRQIPQNHSEQLSNQKIHLLNNEKLLSNRLHSDNHQDFEIITKDILEGRIRNKIDSSYPLQPKDQYYQEEKLANAVFILSFMEEFEPQVINLVERNSTIDMLEFPILWH